MAECAAQTDPLQWFRYWHADARRELSTSADILAFATANIAGAPSVRFVHFKGLQSGGFLFYTNYESRKARDLASNSSAAMAFFWPPLRRQVRIEGQCHRLDRADSERYFATRERENQLTTAASDQSRELDSLETLDARVEKARTTYAGRPIPCPAFWGGIILVPQQIEFWEGRPHRRHHRHQYQRCAAGWRPRLLFP
jgi:pyridoxamine 5'-phosphate oxidase